MMELERGKFVDGAIVKHGERNGIIVGDHVGYLTMVIKESDMTTESEGFATPLDNNRVDNTLFGTDRHGIRFIYKNIKDVSFVFPPFKRGDKVTIDSNGNEGIIVGYKTDTGNWVVLLTKEVIYRMPWERVDEYDNINLKQIPKALQYQPKYLYADTLEITKK